MSAPTASPVATRPSAYYFAPDLRLIKLEDKLQTGGENGSVLKGHILADLVSAEVTMVNTGLATYTLTFNNTILTTAKDRKDEETAGTADYAPPPTGAWPRYKYNDFDVFRFGRRLRVEFRYWPEAPGDATEKAAASQKWVPMVSGPITDIDFSFTDEGARIIVSGEDDLRPLKDKSPKRVQLNRMAEKSMVERALQKAKYPLTSIATPLVDYPGFATNDGNGLNDVIRKDQSYYEFIQHLAERFDFEVFLEFADMAYDGNNAPAQEFHFEPFRGRKKPQGGSQDVYTLERDKNLIDFAPTLSVADQYTGVDVRGRHRDPQDPTEVRGTADSGLRDELHIDSSKDGTLSTAKEVREFFFPDRENKTSPQNVTNLDQARADCVAEAVMRKKARELLTVAGTTLGLPRLRPGRHVELRGMRAPFDGFYYVTKTTHSYGRQGFRTKFWAERPGMELPPYRMRAAEGTG